MRSTALYQRAALFLSLALTSVLASPLPAQTFTNRVHGPDSIRQEGVPKGKVTKHRWATSKVFPGTERDYWVYVPSQYSSDKPACVMVFQDGGGYVAEQGDYRVPVVFDNLIHKGEMPVTIGIFVNPGEVLPLRTNALARYNRSFEYDAVSDRYARFLIEEILPEVGKSYNLTKDPNGRAISGASSGAIAAFGAAWHRPDAFRRVYSTIGTYVGLRGGNEYPVLIRKTEPKPLRVFIQDGRNDLNIYAGNWWLANLEMVSSLELAGYEVEHEYSEGRHDGKHGGPLLPDALRWLWKGYPNEVTTHGPTRLPIFDVLIPGEDWKLVGQGYTFTEGPCVNAQGDVFFTDIPKSHIYRIGADGTPVLWKENTQGAGGMMFGPDGRLYAGQTRSKKIVAYDATGQESVIAEGIENNDICVTQSGDIYVTDSDNKQIWHVNAKGQKRVVDKGGLGYPNGVRTSPDQSLLLVSDMRGQFVWSWQIAADGSLLHKQPYHHLHLPEGVTESGADGMTLDRSGRLYVTSNLGIQFCDQPGRVNGIISKPQASWIASVVIGGANFDTLYVMAQDKVFSRKVKTRGFVPSGEPIKPPVPGL